MTQFGACSDSDRCIAEINRVARSADIALHSWTYWQFKYFDDIITQSGLIEGFYTTDGQLQQNKVAALSRTYAPKIAGMTRKMSYDHETAAFRLQYMLGSPASNSRTKILPNAAMNYWGGCEVHAINSHTQHGTNQIFCFFTQFRVSCGCCRYSALHWCCKWCLQTEPRGRDSLDAR